MKTTTKLIHSEENSDCALSYIYFSTHRIEFLQPEYIHTYLQQSQFECVKRKTTNKKNQKERKKKNYFK